MRRFLILCAAHPWWSLFSLLAFSLLAGTQLHRVDIQISAEELLLLDDPERAYYEIISNQFGDEKVVLLYLEDSRLLEVEKLQSLQEVVSQLERLSFVNRVESLFSVPHLKSIDGYLNKDPYLKNLPKSKEEEQRLLSAAIGDPFIKNVLLSSNEEVMAVAIILDENDSSYDDQLVTSEIDLITQTLNVDYTRVFVIGYPYVRSAISNRIQQEQKDLFPFAIGALLIALFLLLRQFVDILTPILTSGISILWTLGLMGFSGIPLNVVTSIVPILLIIVGSTEDIHLLSEFRRAQNKGIDTQAAIRHMSNKMARTVLLTFITTYVGFLSVGLSRIEVLWQFGIIASTGLLFNYIVTVTLIPSLLAITGRWQLDGKTRFFKSSKTNVAKLYWQWLFRRRWAILFVLTVCSVIAALGIPAIQVNHNTIESLGKNSEVRKQVEAVNTQLAGLETFSIILDSGIQDTFLKVRYLEEVVEIQNFIAEQGLSRSTTSFANYLSILNGVFQELDQAVLPESDDEINELMIFLDHNHVKAYVSDDYSRIRILVRHHATSSRELEHFVATLREFIDTQLDPGLEARITGSSVLTLSATQSMIHGQIQSISLLLIFFIGIISILFTDLRVGLLAAIPNAFPVVVLFGVMGYADIPLNIGTAMAAAIAIGIAVDDTMHFMLRYNQELKSSRRQTLAMHTTISSEALPVLSTSIALIAGFLVFTLSDFQPIVLFGLLSALAIGVALIADFMITPLAISSLRLVTLWDMLSAHLRQQVIPQSVLFREMSRWQIRRFILSSAIMKYDIGETIFKPGDQSNEMYLIMHGSVEVRVPGKERGEGDLVVNRFRSGELFGDIALLAGEPRKTYAVSLEPTSILVLSRDAIKNTTFLHPIIAGRLFLNLATDVSRRWVGFIDQLSKDKEH
ncbi:MAG: MMPL family transporter [Pseudomonadota bacterium]